MTGDGEMSEERGREQTSEVWEGRGWWEGEEGIIGGEGKERRRREEMEKRVRKDVGSR